MTAREKAMLLLEEEGCPLDTYRNDTKGWAFDDVQFVMKTSPDRLGGFDPIEVALELQQIGDEQHPRMKNPEWMVIWDGDSFSDSWYCESFEEAKNDAIDTLIEWQMQMVADHLNLHSKEFIDSYNYMVTHCETHVKHREPIPVPEDTDDDDMGWEDYWYPSEQDLKDIGWEETTEGFAL